MLRISISLNTDLTKCLSKKKDAPGDRRVLSAVCARIDFSWPDGIACWNTRFSRSLSAGSKIPSAKRNVSNLINTISGSRTITLCELIEIIAALKHIESRFR